MSRASELGREIARRVLREERASEGNEGERPAAVSRATVKLHRELSDLLGLEGVQALHYRALRLARAEHPALAGVEARPRGELAGIRQAIERLEDADAEVATRAILANAIWLMISFLGEDLVVRLVRGIWPGLTLEDLHGQERADTDGEAAVDDEARKEGG